MNAELGPVEVVGAGLIGTSIALACRRAGIDVLLTDTSPEHLRTASGLGAGRAKQPEDVPALVVVAVPPDHLATAIAAALDGAGDDTIVTDVGSVKSAPLDALAAHPHLARYVGSHPMAGSERSGPLAASADLFTGRPWAITPHASSRQAAVRAVASLVEVCGAVPVRLTPEEHDLAVARTSHVPHLMSALVAGTLAGAAPDHLALTGQGVRDVTRVAGGDPTLYSQIIGGNSAAVAGLLREVRDRLDLVLEAVTDGDRVGLESLLAHGVAGTRAIPGKHGGPVQAVAAVHVAVPDHPGELARLFADVGASGVNIEDVRIDHDPGRPVGLVELDVAEGRAVELVAALESKGWVTHR
ncbi:prephenate dehydrogenase [Nocardioides humilatus]|uniref:Prephenate dehydrogenase n=1 Tax=Nocardioides humilatus TaxID=2607660 RepID=A0A5B1L5S4_9ACTN|nr:prephenate dehydrogenase [Nocardioides humilatus]KAA1415993.1 prephenate dehydrogenase [Nocardioides humilatus]